MNDKKTSKLELRGGAWGALLLLLIALAFVVYAAASQAKIDGYVVAFLMPIIFGIFLAKDEKAYGEAVVGGLTKPMFAIIALAVLLAAVSGQLVSKSGMIQSIANLAITIGLTGKLFVGITFVLTCIISFSTGTSVGTYFVVIPILFPSGVLSGADPAFLVGAIAAGGAFGDNLAPISDTTIASATTQGMDIGGVVSSRMKYSLPVAVLALLAYLLFCPNHEVVSSAEVQEVNPLSLIMLVVPIVIITLCLMRKHLITALTVGTVVGMVVGLISGIFTPSALLNFPGPFKIEGIITAGITGALPTVAFLLVMFPFIGIMESSGTLDLLGNGLSKIARGKRSVEVVTVGATGILSMVTGVISVAIISVGDIVKKLGIKYDVDGYRRANLMDCAGAAFCFIVPWTVHAIVPAMLAGGNNPLGDAVQVSPASVPLHNFYAWIMVGMLVFAIVTGYGRVWVNKKKVGIKE